MHSCCCIGFIEWCGFGFICFGFKNLFKWFGKQIRIKKGERAYLCCWRPGGPPGPTCFFFLAGGPNRAVFSSSRTAWAGPGSHSRALPSPVSLTGRARMSAVPSSFRRNRAGDERHHNRIHRGNRDFLSINVVLEAIKV
jgi:hypothetical protein